MNYRTDELNMKVEDQVLWRRQQFVRRNPNKWGIRLMNDNILRGIPSRYHNSPTRTVQKMFNKMYFIILFIIILCFVERGSSVVECRTRNQVSPGSNPPLLPCRILGIFVLSIDAPVNSAV